MSLKIQICEIKGFRLATQKENDEKSLSRIISLLVQFMRMK